MAKPIGIKCNHRVKDYHPSVSRLVFPRDISDDIPKIQKHRMEITWETYVRLARLREVFGCSKKEIVHRAVKNLARRYRISVRPPVKHPELLENPEHQFTTTIGPQNPYVDRRPNKVQLTLRTYLWLQRVAAVEGHASLAATVRSLLFERMKTLGLDWVTLDQTAPPERRTTLDTKTVRSMAPLCPRCRFPATTKLLRRFEVDNTRRMSASEFESQKWTTWLTKQARSVRE